MYSCLRNVTVEFTVLFLTTFTLFHLLLTDRAAKSYIYFEKLLFIRYKQFVNLQVGPGRANITTIRRMGITVPKLNNTNKLLVSKTVFYMPKISINL